MWNKWIIQTNIYMHTYNDESHFFDKAYAAILNCIQNMKSEIDEEIKENAS